MHVSVTLPRMTMVLSLLAADGVGAQGSLGIPGTIDGYPTNVGLLILGHSTSAQGQYPAKLAAVLNDSSHTQDARHYLPFAAITGSDGGLLWSVVSAAPADLVYARTAASQGVGESPAPQWCEDGTALRWSCRRSKIEQILRGGYPIPASGSCADASVANACRLPNTMTCIWYDRSRPPNQNPVTEQLSAHQCWLRMDYRLALLQDTSNRSWPIDDFTLDGQIDANDTWPVARITRPQALPCPQSSGVVAGQVDWNCDLVINGDDAAAVVYAGWLHDLATQLLDRNSYGAAALDAVVVSAKPPEMGQCQLWPLDERPTCTGDRHALRTPAQIAATPHRPYDRYYVPTVYWEYRVIETLFARPGLDARVLHAGGDNALAMTQQGARCYADGLNASDWQIPAAVPGRPTLVAADISEIDGGASANANTVGCMVVDHIHHNDNGGWMMTDVWYRGLADPLWAGVPDPIFRNGFEPPR